MTSRPPLPSLEEIDRELAERSLHEFVRQAWHVLEPAKPYSDNWHIQAICEHLEAIRNGHIRNLLINVPPGHMKLCADSTPVATPDGYRTHGDLKPGDRVFGPDGLPTRVVAISPKAPADYEVRFNCGEVIKCNGDHLWRVWDRWARKWKTMRTEDIASAQPEPGRSRFFIPDTECLQFDAKALPLHPYFLGCWLGDGTSTKPCITHDATDREHIAKLEALGFVATTSYGPGQTRATYFTGQGIIEAVRRLGLYGNKHIPEVYLTASESQRLELLAGIIDTDGHLDRARGRVRISTCNPVLAGQIELLAFSLGFRPYICTAKAPGYGAYPSEKTVYQVGFQVDRPLPTAIPRKQVERFDFARRRRAIVEIRKAANPEIGHCITVDRPDGLYVVGRANLVTHNSLLVSVFWPCWEWTTAPATRWLCAAYAQQLSTRDSLKCRRLIRSDWYQKNWGKTFQIQRDQDQKTRFENTATGYRIASSVDGVATGERGDRVIVDDPHNVKEANSDVQRVAALTWWDETMTTRVIDAQRSAKVIIMQRLHEKDLSGHILAKESAHEWEHICLPGEFEPERKWVASAKVREHLTIKEDPRSNDGEMLWADLFPQSALDSWRSDLGEYGFAGQVQQRPAPREGGLFQRRWFEIVPAAPAKVRRRVRWWDLAATKKIAGNDPDWTVGLRMSIDDDGIYYVEHVERLRESPQTVERTIKNVASQDGRSVQIGIPKDPGQAGKMQSQYLVRQLAGYRVRAVAESGDKATRADPVSSQAEAGNVKVVAGDWNEAFFNELELFPNGAHDDQVDALSGAFFLLTDKGERTVTKLAGF